MAKLNFLGKMIKAFNPTVVKPITTWNRISPPIPRPPESGPIDDRPNIKSLPGSRSSQPSTPQNSVSFGDQKYRIVNHQFVKEYIEALRMLSIHNEDVGQALHNIVSLGNTGHKIFFDRKVQPDQVDEMRNHLINKRKNWAPGQAGMDGLVNKMFSQLMISGALSGEWVPEINMRGIETYILVNPEEIIFTLNKKNVKYTAWQKPRNGLQGDLLVKNPSGMVKLNPYTYQYLALNGDTEIPYGIPPWIPVINRIDTQQNMDKNISFIIDEIGLMGFLDVLVGKPDMADDENEITYNTRLETFLATAKERLKGGFKEGIVVGFKDEHEFQFNSPSKDCAGVVELYSNNEIMLASALKMDASLLGRNYNTSETNITVVFMKMLSELRNIQNIVGTNLEYGYALELRLAGFKFDYLTVKFNKSTIQDDLKSQQAEEIKIRNVKDKRILGIISQDDAADELGYEKPFSPDPMVEWEILAGSAPPKPEGALATDGTKKKADTKKKKGESAKKQRRKDKATPVK